VIITSAGSIPGKMCCRVSAVVSCQGERIPLCDTEFSVLFKLPQGVLCAEHLANREVKDPVVVDVKAKSFLPSNDQYFS
jgi:hypothetical protein